MSKSKDSTPELAKGLEDASRRNFLRVGVTGAGAAVMTAGAAVSPAAASESDADKKKARYQESAHVKKYYQTNRY